MNAIGWKTYFKNKIKHIRNKTGILTDPDSDNIELDRFLFTREEKNSAVVKRHWQRTEKYLAMIKKTCDDHGIRMLLVAYPYGHEVGTNQWAKGRQYWAFDSSRVYKADRAFALIQSFVDENHIPFVSLLKPMLESAQSKLYYHNDGHWTARGHRVAAEAIFRSEAFQKMTGVKTS